VNNSEDTPSKLSVGVLKTELPIGLLLTLGTPIGVSKVPSKSKEEATNAELKTKSSLVSLNFEQQH
jgi:hypothetical protein